MKRITACAVIILIAASGCGTGDKSGANQAGDSSQAGTGRTGKTPGEWISLFNGKDLSGWFVRGKAEWKVVDGVLTGAGGMGHIYADPVVADFEAKGMFRVSENGNSGFYFRSNPPADNPDGFPRGFEAQICNSGDAFTGWLWKPGTPTGKAKELITKDNEWFSMRVKAAGPRIMIWVNDQLMVDYEDPEYKEGHFAIQGHNPGMRIEAKEMYYRVIRQDP